MQDPHDTEFARLEPCNLHARLAFDGVVRELQAQGQSATGRDHIVVHNDEQYNAEVFKYRMRQALVASRPLDTVSASSTEVDTDSDDDARQLGMVWTGHYSFNLNKIPKIPTTGWIAGAISPGAETTIELPLSPDNTQTGLRSHHVSFNFRPPQTGFLTVRSRASQSGSGQVYVNGVETSRGTIAFLNQTPTTIQIGSYAYHFEYTAFAVDAQFKKARVAYFADHLNSPPPILDLDPTPAKDARMFGVWTLNQPLGKGTSGRVFSATDCKGRVVAVKLIDRSRHNATAQHEAGVLRKLTDLPKSESDENRILRLVEMVPSDIDDQHSNAPFLDDVAFITMPCCHATFDKIIQARRGSRSPIATDDMNLFVDALAGLKWLHDQRFVHGDLKPQNIGINGETAVILDLGGCIELSTEDTIASDPGRRGTINFLAPEYEMGKYDRAVDVWSMGIVLFMVIKGYHPWAFAHNPWRAGNELLRNPFHRKYDSCTEAIRKDLEPKVAGDNWHHPRSLNDRLILKIDVLLAMVRHQWAHSNSEKRMTIAEALEHPCWRDKDEIAAKRVRVV